MKVILPRCKLQVAYAPTSVLKESWESEYPAEPMNAAVRKIMRLRCGSAALARAGGFRCVVSVYRDR